DRTAVIEQPQKRVAYLVGEFSGRADPLLPALIARALAFEQAPRGQKDSLAFGERFAVDDLIEQFVPILEHPAQQSQRVLPPSTLVDAPQSARDSLPTRLRIRGRRPADQRLRAAVGLHRRV